MNTSFEQKVRERAYQIWMSAGMMHGKAHEHWIIAEQAIANETGAPVLAKAPTKALAKKAVATKPAIQKAVPKKAPAKKAPAKAAAPKSSKSTGSKETHVTH